MRINILKMFLFFLFMGTSKGVLGAAHWARIVHKDGNKTYINLDHFKAIHFKKTWVRFDSTSVLSQENISFDKNEIYQIVLLDCRCRERQD